MTLLRAILLLATCRSASSAATLSATSKWRDCSERGNPSSVGYVTGTDTNYTAGWAKNPSKSSLLDAATVKVDGGNATVTMNALKAACDGLLNESQIGEIYVITKDPNCTNCIRMAIYEASAGENAGRVVEADASKWVCTKTAEPAPVRDCPPEPMCWSGIAGSNSGPSCMTSALGKSTEYEKGECSNRQISNMCIENNEGMGQGDGCPDHTNKSSCESYRSGERNAESSYDGTNKHCRWIPEYNKSQKKDNCEADAKCKWWDDRGDCSTGTCMGNCEDTEAATTNRSNWEKQRGTECDQRLKAGCFENNQWLGEAERCSQHKNESTCLAQTTDCSEGVCSGNATSGSNCSSRISSGDCNQGCSWTPQCCQWLPKPTDLQSTCMNKGKGTMDGMCSYSDGIGPPPKDIVEAGFEHSMFTKGDMFTDKCALVASFRNGSGSATILGSNQADLIGTACTTKSAAWKSLAEHIGHNDSTIAEYCDNFVPDASFMAAMKGHSPAFVIKKVEQGQFDAVFPGLAGLMFVVTAKPEFGKCLFTAVEGKWGTGVCTCDKAECNNKAALDLIVDGDMGPMRLLQFIDGSMVHLKDNVNSIVPDLMSADGKLDPAHVGKVTEADVVEIMKLEGMTDLTSKDELWNITQDYQQLVQMETDYKASLLAYPTFQALKLNASKVAAANEAAGVPLYDDDGVPFTFSLQGLSAAHVTAVATATGISEAALQEGVIQAYNVEHELAVNATQPPTEAPATDPATEAPATEAPATEAPAPAPVTSTGNIEVKMSKADAEALTAKPEAKAAFASAIAKTIDVPAEDVTIIAIYVDGVQVGSRRLQEESTVKVDWSVKAAAPIATAAMDTTTLKTNIESEAQAVADVAVVVTEAPAVTVDPQPMPAPSTPTPAPATDFAAASNVGFASFIFFVSTLLGLLL